jgi:hypothetical protein
VINTLTTRQICKIILGDQESLENDDSSNFLEEKNMLASSVDR